MVNKKDLLNELKSFNTQLETHLSTADVNSLPLSQSSYSSQSDDELTTLLASTVMDLRTELALMRKNLSIETEGMVKRQLEEQQKIFSEQFSKYVSSSHLETKKMITSFTQELNEEFSKVKEEFSKVSSHNLSFMSSFSEFKEELLELKQGVAQLQDFNSQGISQEIHQNVLQLHHHMSSLSKELFQKHHLFEKQISLMKKSLSQMDLRLSSSQNQSLKTLSSLSSSLHDVEDNLAKSSSFEQESFKKLQEANTSILESEKSQLKKLKKLKVPSSSSSSLRSISQEVTNKVPITTASEKLLSIEERLAKLDSLR